MPEILLFGLLFTVVCGSIWAVVEIGIKWVILNNILPWINVWRSLRGSLANTRRNYLIFVSAYFLDKLSEIKTDTMGSGLSLFSFLVLRFISNTIIGGAYLFFLKKDNKNAWIASASSNFISFFLLATVFIIILQSNM